MTLVSDKGLGAAFNVVAPEGYLDAFRNSVLADLEAGSSNSYTDPILFSMNSAAVQERDRLARFGLGPNGHAIAEQKKQEKERDERRKFELLLEQLDRQIAFLENQIKEYDEQIVALDALIKLEKIKELDPNNPEHRKLLLAAGFNNPDEWGTLTMEDYERRKAEIVEKRKAARQELDEAVEMRNDVAEHISSNPNENLDFRNKNNPIIDRYAEQNPDFDKGNVTPEQAREILDEHMVEEILRKRPSNLEHEGTWFKNAIQDLDKRKGDPEYVRALDKLIDSMDESTKKALLKDREIDADIRDRLIVDKFDTQYQKIKKLEGSPSYTKVLERIIEQLSENEKTVLLSIKELPEDARKILTDQSTTQHASLNSAPKPLV